MTDVIVKVAAYMPLVNRNISRFMEALDLPVNPTAHRLVTDMYYVSFKLGTMVDDAKLAQVKNNVWNAYNQLGGTVVGIIVEIEA